MDNFSNIEKYKLDFEIHKYKYIDVLKSYIRVIFDFNKHFLSKVKTNHIFLFNKGIISLSLIFRIIFFYTCNLDFSIENLNNFYYYYIEFISSDYKITKKNKEFQLNSIDAFMFILKKSLFNIDKKMIPSKENFNELKNNYFDVIDYYIYIFNNIFTIIFITNINEGKLNNKIQEEITINQIKDNNDIYQDDTEHTLQDNIDEEFTHQDNIYQQNTDEEIRKFLKLLRVISENHITYTNYEKIKNTENIFFLCLMNNLIKKYNLNSELSIFENENITFEIYIEILIIFEKNKNKKMKNFDYKDFKPNIKNNKIEEYIYNFFYK